MSTYKVIQDIEAEDKLVGPLSLRQFIYAGVSAVCLYICFLAITKGAIFLVGIFLPVAAIGGFFAFPWKGEQPTEIWALARLRFMIKPRTRIWNQSGVKDLVTIMAPKKLEKSRPRTNNLSQTEVHSRLKALADTIDSRGWATRNAAYGIYNNQTVQATTSILAGSGNLQPGAVPSEAFAPSSDMFDVQNSVAQNFDAMLNRSSQNIRQRAVQQMQQAQMPAPAPMAPPQPQAAMPYQQPMTLAPQLPAPVMPVQPTYVPPTPVQQTQPATANNAWFMSNPSYPANTAAPQQAIQQAPAPIMPPQPQAPAYSQPQANPQNDVFYLPNNVPVQTGPIPMPAAVAPTPADQQLSQEIRDNMPPTQSINYGHMKVLQPLSEQPAAIDYGNPQQPPVGTYADEAMPMMMPAPTQPTQPVTRQTDPAILELANNDDLDVATIARQASKEIRKSPDEVEIRLH